jgi:hypothetical protein
MRAYWTLKGSFTITKGKRVEHLESAAIQGMRTNDRMEFSKDIHQLRCFALKNLVFVI